MKSNTQRSAIIVLLMVIAWLIYQLGIEIKRVVLVEQGEATEARETGNRSASATDELIYPRVVNG